MSCLLSSEGHPEERLYLITSTFDPRYVKIWNYIILFPLFMISFLTFLFCTPYLAFHLTRCFLQIIWKGKNWQNNCGLFWFLLLVLDIQDIDYLICDLISSWVTGGCTSAFLHVLAHPWTVFQQLSKWKNKH